MGLQLLPDLLRSADATRSILHLRSLLVLHLLNQIFSEDETSIGVPLISPASFNFPYYI